MRARFPRTTPRWAWKAGALSILAACGLVEPTPSGQVTVLLRATGGTRLEVADVRFEAVELEASDGGRVPLALRRPVGNLLHLLTRWDTLAANAAPAQRYVALRVVVRSGYVVLRQRDSTFVVYATPGAEVPSAWAALKPRSLDCELCGRPLTVPLPGAQLDLGGKQRATLEVEFDLDSSLYPAGIAGRVAAPDDRWFLQPTLRVRAVRLTGGS